MCYGAGRLLVSLTFSASVALFIHGGFARAQTPAGEVRQILEIGWKPSQENYDGAKQHYEAAKNGAVGDVRAPFAMALVAIRNHHPTEAAQYVTEALAGGKALLPIRRLEIYLDALQKNKAETKSDIGALIGQLAAGDAARADFQETAKWLGAVIGYLNGPGSSLLSASDVDALESEISSKLKGPLADAAEASAKQVADQYAQFQQQLGQAHQDAKVRNEGKLAEARKQNQAALDEATQGRESAEREYDKFQQQYKQDAAGKNSDLDMIQRKFTTLTGQKMNMQNTLNVEQQKKPELQNKALISQLNDQFRQANIMQDQLNGQSRDIKAWFSKMAAQDGTMTRSIKKQRSLEEGLTKKAKDLEKPATENDATTAALEAKAGAIGTYAALDLDQEKQRILDTYNRAGQ